MSRRKEVLLEFEFPIGVTYEPSAVFVFLTVLQQEIQLFSRSVHVYEIPLNARRFTFIPATTHIQMPMNPNVPHKP